MNPIQLTNDQRIGLLQIVQLAYDQLDSLGADVDREETYTTIRLGFATITQIAIDSIAYDKE